MNKNKFDRLRCAFNMCKYLPQMPTRNPFPQPKQPLDLARPKYFLAIVFPRM